MLKKSTTLMALAVAIGLTNVGSTAYAATITPQPEVSKTISISIQKDKVLYQKVQTLCKQAIELFIKSNKTPIQEKLKQTSILLKQAVIYALSISDTKLKAQALNEIRSTYEYILRIIRGPIPGPIMPFVLDIPQI